MELAEEGGRSKVTHAHWEVVRNGAVKAMYRMRIPVYGGKFSEEEREDVLEYLSLKGISDEVIDSISSRHLDGIASMVMRATGGGQPDGTTPLMGANEFYASA